LHILDLCAVDCKGAERTPRARRHTEREDPSDTLAGRSWARPGTSPPAGGRPPTTVLSR